MRNIKEKLKSKSFWAGLVGTVFLILAAFGIEIGDAAASTAISSVCSALTLFGIISPSPGEAGEEEKHSKQDDANE